MNNKMKLSNMIIFGLGDLFGGGGSVIISFFYLIFLTDIIGIRPVLAGSIILITRIWDAVNDPLMGMITDRTRTRYGRRKPYFLAGFFLIIIAYTLLWTASGLTNELSKYLFALVTYLFYSTVVTMVMVPYSAMSAEVSLDYVERNKINGFRLAFSQFGTLLGAVLPLSIVKLFEHLTTGYTFMGFIFGLFFAIPFLLIFLFVKELPLPNELKKFELKLFLKPLKVRTFRILVGIYICAFITMDVISSIFTYYMTYYFNRPDQTQIVAGILLISALVLLPIIVKLANIIGKGQTFIIGAVTVILGTFSLSFITEHTPLFVMYLIASVIGIGLSPCTAIPWLMFPDTTDVGELKFNERNEGSFSGIMTFMRTLSSAVALFVVSLILEVSGYIPPVDEIYFEQPGSFMIAIKIIITIIPFILLLFSIFLAKIYPLTIKNLKQLRDYLDYQNGKGTLALSADEIKEMEKQLA